MVPAVSDLEKLGAFYLGRRYDVGEQVEALRELPDPAALELEEIPIRPRKSDIAVSRLALAWTPWERTENGVPGPMN